MNKQIIILSWIAIALSIIACIITFLDLDKAQITDDSFIGVMSGFIGACATILVGAQIFNSIETRNSINKLNGKHSKKCTFYTLRFGCSFAAVNTIKPQLL